MKSFLTLEEEVLLLEQEAKKGPLSILEILKILSGKGRVLILLLLCLPFCQPIQIPGFSAPFGLAIAFIGLRISFGKKLWLPKALLNKTIPSETLTKITEQALRIIGRMKIWVRPRFFWFCHSLLMEKVNGLAICLLGILLALPLPIPLSNLTAAWSILLIAFGILEDDGLFVIIGYLVALLTVLFFFVIAINVKNFFGV